MKKTYLFFVVSLLILSSCSNEEFENSPANAADEGFRNTSSTSSRAVVLKHGWDVPVIRHSLSNPEFIEEVENSPYDGVVFSVGDISDEIFAGIPLEQSRIDRAFERMTPNTFSREMQNFVKLNVHGNTGDAQYEGEHIDILVDNVKRFARAANAAGFAGIAFDNEAYYGRNIWEWSSNADESICPGKTREECQDIVRTAGYKVIRAILEEWNTVKIMPFFGMWLRNEGSWDVIQANSIHNRWYNENQLQADFLVGLYGGIHDRKTWDAGCTAEYIDGGEIYSLMEREQFRVIGDHLRNELPMQSTQFLYYLRESYAQNVKIGFGIYDFRNEMFGIAPWTSDQWKTAISNAVKEADYIWLYPEIYDFWEHDGNNWPSVQAPQDWHNATIEALEEN